MEEDNENCVSPSVTETSAAAPDSQNVVSGADAISLQPVQTIVPPVIPAPAPFMPTLAPIPPRPLAPLPIRPVLKLPVAENGEVRASDSDFDCDEMGSNRAAGGSGPDYEISDESRLVRERQEKAMQELLMRRCAAALAVPTNDKAVRARLCQLGEPMTLFGEREMERRDRLRMLMAKLDSEGQLERLMKAHEDEEAAASAAAVAD